MTFSEHLRKPKVTAVAIAREMGVSHSTVLRWAENRVPADRVADLARVTGIPPASLRPDMAAMFAPTEATH